jgi:hypothetical protein
MRRVALAATLALLTAAAVGQIKIGIGPLVGLRLALYDTLTQRYWTVQTRFDWTNSFGLRDNGDGTQTFYVKGAVRNYGMLLTRDVDGNYPLPVGYRVNTAVWRNGVRQSGEDYSIVNNAVVPTPQWPWKSGDKILVDGE